MGNYPSNYAIRELEGLPPLMNEAQNEAYLRGATEEEVQKAGVGVKSKVAPNTDREFGLAVYSALILLANAFYKRFVGGEPRCKCQRNNV